ncbi:hypothetical protein [Butyrivibrio sp. AC2005]|uniref:hypothetical protein n=1 Tax=Butyrivibrio sp. AC2005 TaxID=1280672 RepID=UPI000413FBC8|nr:hypothetical protein [Butyrivibrio sp. AC2005]
MFDIILAYLIWGIWAVVAFNDISPILVIVLFIAAIFATINALSHEAINDESLANNKTPTILASVILCLDVIALIYSCLILSNNESDENAIMIGVVSICLLFPFLIMAIKITKINKEAIARLIERKELDERIRKSKERQAQIKREFEENYLKTHTKAQLDEYYRQQQYNEEQKILKQREADERRKQAEASAWLNAPAINDLFVARLDADPYDCYCVQDIDTCRYCIHKFKRIEGHKCHRINNVVDST